MCIRGREAGCLVADPSGVFHPVQSNIKEQRANHPALGSSLLGRGEPTLLDHTRRQPAGDLSPGWERAKLAEEVLMIDAVERRCQVCVQGPPPLGIRTLGDVEDGLDRIMAATARPKAIGLRFEPKSY